jgi:hypothetical protein
MSQENVEAVRRLNEALDRRNWDGVFAAISPDFEWETDPRHPKAGVYRGREEFRRFIEDLEDPFEQTVTEMEKVFATADQVAVFVRIRRRMKGRLHSEPASVPGMQQRAVGDVERRRQPRTRIPAESSSRKGHRLRWL